MRVEGTVGVLVASALLAAPWSCAAQSPTVVVPGDDAWALDRLAPFEATYRQMGFPMHVRFAREANDGWSFSMEMAGPSGTAIDHIGHAADLSFRYRRFAFGAFRDEVLDAQATPDSIVLHRMPRNGTAEVPLREAHAVDGPVVDGTFMYWALGALNTDGPVAFRVWGPTPDAFEIRTSGTLHPDGEEDVTLPSGAIVRARVFAAETPSGRLRMWVSSAPPYLLQQAIESPDGTVTPIIELGAPPPIDRPR
ncbi:MAG: hypothetical protein AAF389_09120 [Gemmatimonadota bacterium]